MLIKIRAILLDLFLYTPKWQLLLLNTLLYSPIMEEAAFRAHSSCRNVMGHGRKAKGNRLKRRLHALHGLSHDNERPFGFVRLSAAVQGSAIRPAAGFVTFVDAKGR